MYGNRIFAVFRIANVGYNWKSVSKLVELARSACVMSECCLPGLVLGALVLVCLKYFSTWTFLLLTSKDQRV